MHFKKLTIFVVALGMSLFFSACGGGGGSSSAGESATISSTAPASNDVYPKATPVSTQQNTTTFVDAGGVSGLNYKCGLESRTTTAQGAFKCLKFPVSFYVGNLFLGSVSFMYPNNRVYTTDLLQQPRDASRYPEVSKISMILQSLDDDADVTNGINITQKVVDIANQYFYADTNLTAMTTDAVSLNIADIIQTLATSSPAINLTQVSLQDAQDNLTASIAQVK